MSNIIVNGMEYSERKNAWMKYSESYTSVTEALENIASEFNAPRKNGYIPIMTVSVDDDDNVIVNIDQKLSQHMAKKLGL
jgi:glutaredoxin-related protein